MALTKNEKKIVYEACELLETRYEHFACCALENGLIQGMAERCQKFYDMGSLLAQWSGLNYRALTEQDYSQRILMLLWWAEVEGNV